MSKQTAVEWLMEQCKAKIGVGFQSVMEAEFQQAKQMEREQHSDTWIDSRVEDKENDYIGKQKSFDEYFTETYGKEELLP